MKKIIIFDFIRTLFDPDTNALVSDAQRVLQYAAQAGFTLCLISRREGGAREKRVQSLGITEYFDHLFFCDEKTREQFEECIVAVGDIDRQRSFVVGDRIREEIVCGNACNFQTIWVRAGKFAEEMPRGREEQPTFCVARLEDTIPILQIA